MCFQFAVQTLYALEEESLRTVELSADRPYFVDGVSHCLNACFHIEITTLFVVLIVIRKRCVSNLLLLCTSMFTKTCGDMCIMEMSHCLLPSSHSSSTLLCCPLTFIGTVHPVSQIQRGGVFQQSSNKLKKEKTTLFSGCDWALQ